METRYKARGFPQRLGSLRLPLFPQPRRRYYLRTINLEVGPFYSITVGSFYVVKASLGQPEPHLQQTNVLTMIQKLSKNPKARDLLPKYEYLCEIAHPNVIGNAVYWSHVDKVNDDGSETRILKRRHEEGVAGQATENVLWALGWSAVCLRNGFELTRAGIVALLKNLGR